jgi:hypothetical protein
MKNTNQNKIQKLRIISTIDYIGRVLGIVEFTVDDNIYRSLMYRSTGTNVSGRGMWFPCVGVSAPNEIKRTFMHAGWINKGYIYSSVEGLQIMDCSIRTSADHSNPIIRLDNKYYGNPEDHKWSLDELSSMIFDTYDPATAPTIADIQDIETPNLNFINTWALKSLMYIVNGDLEPEETNEDNNSEKIKED